MSNLAERLRAETGALHRQVERSGFMSLLLRGHLERAAYCAYLDNLLVVYQTLERELQRRGDDEVLGCFDWPALQRVDALCADLSHLRADGHAREPAPEPSTRDYVRQLAALADEHPAALLGHAYVRYLGDLSGGQVVSRVVRDALSLPPGPGTAFYAFGDAQRTRALADDFRERLRALRPSPVVEQAVVDEAVAAFAYHQRLFVELEQRCGLSDLPSQRTSTPR